MTLDTTVHSRAAAPEGGARHAHTRALTRWRGPREPAVLEKIMGPRSTLLPVAFLEVGVVRARAVARIVTPGGMGSGFLVAGGLLITNHHVLPSAAVAARARAQFNVQMTLDGLAATPDEYPLEPNAAFATSAADDWSAVALSPHAAARWGVLPVQAAPAQVGDFLTIVQHPQGGPKQVALFHNTVVHADARLAQYLTDTLPGSSGSPCFNEAWEVVALHHAGGWLREPGLPGQVWRNEGIQMGRVLEGLRAAGLLPAGGSTTG